jgi:hypothetical protein
LCVGTSAQSSSDSASPDSEPLEPEPLDPDPERPLPDPPSVESSRDLPLDEVSSPEPDELALSSPDRGESSEPPERPSSSVVTVVLPRDADVVGVRSETPVGIDVVAGAVVVVGAVVLGVRLVDVAVSSSVGGVAVTGFRQTDREVGAPRLGNRVSRMANAVPADPTTNAIDTTAIDKRPADLEDGRRVDGGGATSVPLRENTVGNCPASSPCPVSIQSFTCTTVPHRMVFTPSHHGRSTETAVRDRRSEPGEFSACRPGQVWPGRGEGMRGR